ncbi:MAG: tetratricopeptide repeat protein, partial [Chloroflexi bacterium]
LGPHPDLLAAFSAWASYARPNADVTRLPAEVRPDFVRDQLSQLGRLCVILDDAWDGEATKTLIKALPPGTSILLTTSDPDLAHLPNCSVSELSPLDENESLGLLSNLISPPGQYEEAAKEIVHLAEGMPLALELVAGMAKSPSNLPAIAIKLGQKPRFAHIHPPETETPTAGVETCLAASYASLSSSLQASFRLLVIFPAPFEESALVAIWGQADSESLNTLLRCRLLNRDERSGLLNQHSLIRTFAAALLRENESEKQLAAQRHANYYLEQAAKTKERYNLGAENMRAALNRFNLLWPHLNTAYKRIIQSPGQGQGSAESRWLSDFPEKIIYALDLHLPPEQMIAIIETGLAAARRMGDKQSESIHLVNLGFAYSTTGNIEQAIKYYEQALPLKREVGDLRGESKALGNLGLAYAELGEIRRAIEYHEQQLAITRQAHDRAGEAAALRNLGLACASIGNSHRAVEYFNLALAIDREIGDRRSEGRTLGNLGLAYADRREPQKAIEYYEQALKVTREIGDRRGEGGILGNLGIIYYALGDVYSAIEHYEQHLNITRLIGDRRGEGNALGNLGIAYKKLGDPYMAMEYYEQALVIDQATGDKLGEANDCWNMGLLFEEQGNLARAAHLMQVRVDYLASIGHTDVGRYARYLTDLQKKLEEQQAKELEVEA